MKNSLAALLADDKARVVPVRVHGSAFPYEWMFNVYLETDTGLVTINHRQSFPTRSEAELAGEALRDKAKEQVNR